PPTGPSDPQTVTAPLTNNGRKNLRSGIFTVTVFSSGLGITDVAGNPLDGEFFGRFSSGNRVPGGDFVAIVDALHNRILAIGPSQQGTAIRKKPAAIPGFRGHHTGSGDTIRARGHHTHLSNDMRQALRSERNGRQTTGGAGLRPAPH